MNRSTPRLGLLSILVCMVSCGPAPEEGDSSREGGKEGASSASGEENANSSPKEAEKEPDYVTVQHILIGFKGSVRGKPITRSKEEAKGLAEQILKRAQAGEAFDALVKEHTDDSHPGIYKMANLGVTANTAEKIYPRTGMVPAFGNVGFRLRVGEVGMAGHDTTSSPFGWHIIKRVE